MYFSSFPVMPYDSIGDYEFKTVTNILRRVALRSKVKNNVLVFDTYQVKEGETPEMVAAKLYNDPELHWVVVMVNDIRVMYIISGQCTWVNLISMLQKSIVTLTQYNITKLHKVLVILRLK
jgi:Base plate wedge protein 53.